MILLYDYKLEPSDLEGKLPSREVFEYYYEYNDKRYLVHLELDCENVLLYTIYELDDVTVKFAGDTGKNLYQVFNKFHITKEELIQHCNEDIQEYTQIIFANEEEI